MLKIALRGLRANKARYIATLVAIMTGVAFLAAGYIVTDTAASALGGEVKQRYASVDAVVRPPQDAVDLNLRIPGDVLPQVAALPGVAQAIGELDGGVSILDDVGKPVRGDSRGRLWVEDDALNPIDITKGRAPAAAGEVALSEKLADRADVAVGDTVTLATAVGKVQATVVGLTKVGKADSLDQGGTISIPAVTAFEWINAGKQEYVDLLVRGSGATQADLVASISPLIPPGLEVVTGAQFIEDEQGAAAGIAKAIQPALVAFSLLSLFVCGFVIFNTFSVVVSQRIRELALLRAIAATPKQIRRSVLAEGAVVGLIGSVLGVVVGAGLAKLLEVVLSLFHINLPGNGLTLTGRTIYNCIFSGTLITVMSVRGPAKRASRIAPVEALRDSGLETAATSRKRAIASIVLLGGGVAAMLGGAAAGKGQLLGIGVAALFIGLIVAGPFFAKGFAKIAFALLKGTGVTGRLATDNAARNPRRTAITANALVIGLFLITTVAVAGQAMRSWTVQAINRLTSADFIIQADAASIPESVLAQARATNGVQVVAPVTSLTVENASGNSTILSTGTVADLVEAAGLKVKSGSLDALAAGGVAVVEGSGATNYQVGDTAAYTKADGTKVELPVVAVFDFGIDNLYVSNLVAPETFTAKFGDEGLASLAFVRVDRDLYDDVKDSLETVTAEFGNVRYDEGNYLGRLINDLFGFAIKAVSGLLLMSVAIALIGIVNTMSLSIIERRREIGVLRAIGVTPRQIRTMIRIESAIIAGIGTLTGILGGLFVGIMVGRTIGGVPMSIPYLQLSLMLLGGVVVGVLASAWSARKASKLEVLDALRA